MKHSGNVELCLLILWVTFILPKDVSISSGISSIIYFDPSSVTKHPLCYSTLDVPKLLLEDLETFLGKLKVSGSISRQNANNLKVFFLQ